MPRRRTAAAPPTTREIARLPMPERWEPRATQAALMQRVRGYFEALYNGAGQFRDYLASVGNQDSITENRAFDRYKAVEMIKDMARENGDLLTANASEGKIYQKVATLMRGAGLGLRVRRQEYARLTHQPAE
jgi:fido (protein-threonine AMPylation protein)